MMDQHSELRELIDERRADRVHAVEVARGELHHEAVGNEDAVARDDGGLRVEFTSQSARDLDRLKTALERSRKGAVDGPLESSFEAVQKPQGSPLSRHSDERSG